MGRSESAVDSRLGRGDRKQQLPEGSRLRGEVDGPVGHSKSLSYGSLRGPCLIFPAKVGAPLGRNQLNCIRCSQSGVPISER